MSESLDPGTTGEPECAIRCMLHPYDRCHFYAWINSRCYFGDLNGPHWNEPHRRVLSSSYSDGTMKMFQPPLSSEGLTVCQFKLNLTLLDLGFFGKAYLSR